MGTYRSFNRLGVNFEQLAIIIDESTILEDGTSVYDILAAIPQSQIHSIRVEIRQYQKLLQYAIPDSVDPAVALESDVIVFDAYTSILAQLGGMKRDFEG